MNIRSLKESLTSLTAEDLENIVKAVNAECDNRANQRKKELWGNVVAALKKYEEEVESIEVGIDHLGIDLTDTAADPGYIYLYN